MTREPQKDASRGKDGRGAAGSRNRPPSAANARAAENAPAQEGAEPGRDGRDVETLDVGQHDPLVLAKAEIQAFNDFFTILADRVNRHGVAATKVIAVDGGAMICFLMADGSYGNCRPYTIEA